MKATRIKSLFRGLSLGKIGGAVKRSAMPVKQTAGLTMMLDRNKVNHTIMDVRKKTEHLFKFKK